MPRPHYPAKGGLSPVGWKQPAGDAIPSYTVSPRVGEPDIEALQTELQQLKKEMARASRSEAFPLAMPTLPEGGPSIKIVWSALAFCGLCLIFALYAFWRR